MFDFLSFYREQNPRVISLALSCGLQHADCEDIASIVWIEFDKKLQEGKINHSENISGYLFNIARWRITDSARKIKTRTKDQSLSGEENDMDLLPAREVLDTSWKKELILRAANSIKNDVNEKHHQLFIEQVFRGKTAGQVAKETGLKESNVYLAKHRIGKKVIEKAKELLTQKN